MKPVHPLVSAARAIGAEVAARHAADVDEKARFPQETVDAMKSARLLSAAVPTEFGGGGCTMSDLGEMCAAIAQGCGSSGMVLAMHHIQVASMARHGAAAPTFEKYLRDLARDQYVVSSITSEVGTSGDTRSSICAVERKDGRYILNKEATTGSYCANADDILVTCRRNGEAPANDQVLVLVRKGDYTLKQTTTWDTLGMRGTCSPGFSLQSSGDEAQIVPGSFAESAAQSMVPYSHVLWSSLWWGIAADAVSRAAAYVRGEARKKPGTVPATATRLAEASVHLQAMRHNWVSVAADFDALGTGPEGMQELLSIGWALKFNNLKMSASAMAPQIVHQALQILGLLGYKNGTPFSVGRHYRDALSASIMISNERIASKSASMLLVYKDL